MQMKQFQQQRLENQQQQQQQLQKQLSDHKTLEDTIIDLSNRLSASQVWLATCDV